MKNSIKRISTRKANDIACTTAIIAENYFKELYEKSKQGYMWTMECIVAWATEFVNKYGRIRDWESFIDSKKCPFKMCACWDDCVITFGASKLETI